MGETEKKTTGISQEKIVKKDPGAGKREKDVPKKQSGTRRQNSSKTGLEADDGRRPKACRKNSSAGYCHYFYSSHESVWSKQYHHL